MPGGMDRRSYDLGLRQMQHEKDMQFAQAGNQDETAMMLALLQFMSQREGRAGERDARREETNLLVKQMQMTGAQREKEFNLLNKKMDYQDRRDVASDRHQEVMDQASLSAIETATGTNQATLTAFLEDRGIRRETSAKARTEGVLKNELKIDIGEWTYNSGKKMLDAQAGFKSGQKTAERVRPGEIYSFLGRGDKSKKLTPSKIQKMADGAREYTSKLKVAIESETDEDRRAGMMAEYNNTMDTIEAGVNQDSVVTGWTHPGNEKLPGKFRVISGEIRQGLDAFPYSSRSAEEYSAHLRNQFDVERQKIIAENQAKFGRAQGDISGIVSDTPAQERPALINQLTRDLSSGAPSGQQPTPIIQRIVSSQGQSAGPPPTPYVQNGNPAIQQVPIDQAEIARRRYLMGLSVNQASLQSRR